MTSPQFVPVIREVGWHTILYGNPHERIQSTSNDKKVILCNKSKIQICTLDSVGDYVCALDIKGTLSVLDVACAGGKVYVADGCRTPGGVLVYRESTGQLLHWIPVGFPDNRDKGAVGIAVADDSLYVASFIDNNIICTSAQADKEPELCQFTSKAECGELEGPRYIAASCDTVAVSCASHKVILFNRKAEIQGIYGTGVAGSDIGQLKNPSGVVIDTKGNLIVVDWGNNRLCVMSAAAKHLTCFKFERSPIQSHKITFNNNNELLVSYGKLYERERSKWRYDVYTFEYKQYTKQVKSNMLGKTNTKKCPKKVTGNRSTQTTRTVLTDQGSGALYFKLTTDEKPVTENVRLTEAKTNRLQMLIYIVTGWFIGWLFALYVY